MASKPTFQAEVSFFNVKPKVVEQTPSHSWVSPIAPCPGYMLCSCRHSDDLFSASTAWGLGFSVQEGTDSCFTSYTMPHVPCGVPLKKYSLSHMRPETAWLECGYGDGVEVVLAHSLGV